MMRRLSGGLAAAFCVALAACTVEQVDEGEPPTIEPGEAPAYEVEPADVDVGWDTATVRVPDVDVSPRQDTVVPADTLPR